MNNKLNIAAKIAGGLTAGLLLYDSHKVGVNHSAENIKIRSAERLTDVYTRSRRMEDRSPVTSSLKDRYFRDHADWNFADKVNGFTGYIKGGFDQLARNIVPAALATGTLLSKNYAKYFGAGLVAYGIKYLLCDVIDIGRVNHLKSNY